MKLFTQQKSRGNGFTLIELLVVIAIIGLLASIILASLSSAQAKGRDARRISDVKQVQLALELFYDANAYYPTQATALSAAPTSAIGMSVLTPALTPAYISQIPTDPTATGNYFYQYQSLNSDGTICNGSPVCQGYVLVVQLETSGNSSTSWIGTITGDAAGLCPTSPPSSAPYPYCVHS